MLKAPFEAPSWCILVESKASSLMVDTDPKLLPFCSRLVSCCTGTCKNELFFKLVEFFLSTVRSKSFYVSSWLGSLVVSYL